MYHRIWTENLIDHEQKMHLQSAVTEGGNSSVFTHANDNFTSRGQGSAGADVTFSRSTCELVFCFGAARARKSSSN